MFLDHADHARLLQKETNESLYFRAAALLEKYFKLECFEKGNLSSYLLRFIITSLGQFRPNIEKFK